MSDTGGSGEEEGAVVEMGEWSSLVTLDVTGYEFRVIESPSASSSSYSDSELADAFE